MLSGAGLIKGASNEYVHVHTTAQASTGTNEIDLEDALLADEVICDTAPIFVSKCDDDGSLTGEIIANENFEVDEDGKKLVAAESKTIAAGQMVFVDFYIKKASNKVNEIQIDMEHFGGYFYVEANSLWRDTDGVDHAVELTFPNVKIQSNFTFNYSATGDPSTFTFTMDAFPGATTFNPNKKVLLAMQVIDDGINGNASQEGVFPCND